MGAKGTVAAAASWGLGGGLAAWLLALGPVAGVGALQWVLLAATPLLAALLVTLRVLRPGGGAAGTAGDGAGGVEGAASRGLALPWRRRSPGVRPATTPEPVQEPGAEEGAASGPEGVLLRKLQADMAELRRAVAQEREAPGQTRSPLQSPDARAAPALGGPSAHPDDAALRTLRNEMEEARRAALQELEAARQAREAAEGMKGQAEAALRQAERIQAEALRFRREDQDALSKGVALFAQAQEARRRTAEELEAARREAQRLLEAAHGERQALEESLRHSMEEQKVALLREAYHAKAQAEQQMEYARKMAEEAGSLRQMVQGELEQVLRMRQDVDVLRQQALSILDQVSRGGSLPEPAPHEPPPAGRPREGVPPPAGERPLTREGMRPAAPPPPEATEHLESAQEPQRQAEEAPSQGDFQRQMADIARALDELGRRSQGGPAQGAAGEPAPQERQPAPPSQQAPRRQEPAHTQPPRPEAAPPPANGGTLEEELAAILGRTSAGQEPSPPLEEPAAPVRGKTPRPASQGAAGAGAAAAGPLSGQFRVTVRPMLHDDSLGRFWTLLEKTVGIGNILAATPLADGSGMEFTVDVGREKVALADLAGGVQGSQVVVEGTGRVVVALPADW